MNRPQPESPDLPLSLNRLALATSVLCLAGLLVYASLFSREREREIDALRAGLVAQEGELQRAAQRARQVEADLAGLRGLYAAARRKELERKLEKKLGLWDLRSGGRFR